ncbi:hypothetical protein [Actinoplanes rectilineatus]|uniref:hypothetical protein n=1 Tax=Actinoplanes rectilineatus TaxID=113571 RepID=UPI0012FC7BB6|nr:hypothetical protein [Actinoplanes rectilineatus]
MLADMDSIADGTADPWAPQRLLAGMLRHPFLQSSRYSDAGPPPDARRLQAPAEGIAEGWISLSEGIPGDRGGFVYSAGSRAGFTGYEPETAAWIADLTTSASRSLEGVEARQRDGIAAAVAISLHPDVFITSRPHLLACRDRIRGVTICDVGESLALLGLYLRAQGDFRYWFDPDGGLTPAMSRSSFYWVGVRELVPQAWRWVTGCAQAGKARADDSLLDVALSVLERLVQVLKCRDAMHRHLNQPVRDVRGDDAIEAFEAALTLLLAAADASAATTHRVLQISGEEKYASWQAKQWRDRVKRVSPALAAVTTDGTAHNDALLVLRHLRNSLHADAMLGGGLQRPGRSPIALMSLPRNRQTEIVDAIERMGGREQWSVQPYRGTELRVDPGTVLELLLPRIILLLNDVMRETPLDSLPEVSITPADSLPPASADGIFDEFSAPQRACIRALLGL